MVSDWPQIIRANTFLLHPRYGIALQQVELPVFCNSGHSLGLDAGVTIPMVGLIGLSAFNRRTSRVHRQKCPMILSPTVIRLYYRHIPWKSFFHSLPYKWISPSQGAMGPWATLLFYDSASRSPYLSLTGSQLFSGVAIIVTFVGRRNY